MRITEIEDKDYNSMNVPMTKEIIEKLSSKCQNIIKCYQQSGEVLFRGLQGQSKNTAAPFIYKQIRTDRKPVELHPEAQELIHNELQFAGISTTRSNSAFCSSRLELASDWGVPYIIFPIGSWAASWFEGLSEDSYSFVTFNELWQEANMGKANVAKTKGPIAAKKYVASNFLTSLDAMFEEYPPRETSNPDVLAKYLMKDPAEVMISGPAYYALKVDNDPEFGSNQILKALGITK